MTEGGIEGVPSSRPGNYSESTEHTKYSQSVLCSTEQRSVSRGKKNVVVLGMGQISQIQQAGIHTEGAPHT